MRNILTTILILAALTVAAQNYSPCYKEKYETGVTLYNKGDYNGAKAKFVAAKGCPMPNTKEAEGMIKKCNDAIQDAEKARLELEAYGRCTSVEKCDEYLKKYPNGRYVAEVKKKQDGLKAKQKEEIISLAQTYTVNGVSFMMKYVEGGTFTMGCSSEQKNDCDKNETPSHQVTVSDFCIGETEVTQALWEAVMGSTISQQRDKAGYSSLYGEGSLYPMYYINWNDAVEFCNKINEKLRDQLLSGYKFALPTEAQWEYAARGGIRNSTYKYSGPIIGDVAWYDENSGGKTHMVKTRKANELGLYDMIGNVWEWCSDWCGSYSDSAQTNPKGPSEGVVYRVLRGGGWISFAWYCRVSYRLSYIPDNRGIANGFRLALVRQ